MVHIIPYHSDEPRILIPEEIDEEGFQGRATREEIDNLLETLGGFGKWPELNNDCRKAVTEHLDIQSLLSLQQCSRRDKESVNVTNIHVVGLEIHDRQDEFSIFKRKSFKNDVLVNIQFHSESHQYHHVLFSQSGNDTHVRVLQKDHDTSRETLREPQEVRTVLKFSNHYIEAVRFAEKWIKRGKFNLERLVVNMNEYPIQDSVIEFLPKCQELQVKSNDHRVLSWWLLRVPDIIKKLSLMRYQKYAETEGVPGDILPVPYSTLRCDTFDINISRFVEAWANGNVHENFEILKIVWRDGDPPSNITGPQVRPWSSEEFSNDPKTTEIMHFFNRRFYFGYKCFQVYNVQNPRDSITVCIARQEVYIIRTGRQVSDGEPQTQYSIPEGFEWAMYGSDLYS